MYVLGSFKINPTSKYFFFQMVISSVDSYQRFSYQRFSYFTAFLPISQTLEPMISISESLFHDVLQHFTPFYLYTLSFVVLNCLFVPLECGTRVTQKKKKKKNILCSHYAVIMNNKVLSYLYVSPCTYPDAGYSRCYSEFYSLFYHSKSVS